jgi:hypothetical protein
MNRGELARLWSSLFGGAVPPNMSQGLQRRFIAQELQIRAAGDLPSSAAARLDRIAAGKERASTPTLQPGGRYLRQWNGTTHIVDVVKDGYLWNGARHRSLSAIARAITGTRWSGPRFFGLTGAGDSRRDVA